MFGAIGTMVFRLRYAVIAVLILMMSGLGLFGLDLGKHLSQSGWFDPTSESVKGSEIADTAFGRDHKSDVIVLVTPPKGTRVDDKAFGAKVEKFVNTLVDENPDVVGRDDPGIFDPFQPVGSTPAAQAAQKMKEEQLFSADRTQAFISIGIKGDNDTEILENFKKVEHEFTGIAERFDLPGTGFETAGLQPIAGAMARGMDEDIHRAELIALPLVALMLFFVFGGAVAAVLPVLIGGLTIAVLAHGRQLQDVVADRGLGQPGLADVVDQHAGVVARGVVRRRVLHGRALQHGDQAFAVGADGQRFQALVVAAPLFGRLLGAEVQLALLDRQQRRDGLDRAGQRAGPVEQIDARRIFVRDVEASVRQVGDRLAVQAELARPLAAGQGLGPGPLPAGRDSPQAAAAAARGRGGPTRHRRPTPADRRTRPDRRTA